MFPKYIGKENSLGSRTLFFSSSRKNIFKKKSQLKKSFYLSLCAQRYCNELCSLRLLGS